MTTAELMHQKDLERLKALRYMDDDFMTVCLADNTEAVELILQILLEKADIKVKTVRTQESFKNLRGRSAILDVHAIDSTGKEFDIEIQRADAGAGAKRARHNSSLLDAHILNPGDRTKDLPDSYVIFISENDVMKGGQPLYPVERYVAIGEKKVLFGDGSHILYVNGTYRGNDAIGRLMHDFCCTEPEEMNYEALAEKAKYFKYHEKGVAVMCKLLEDMREEASKKAARDTKKQMALRMIKSGKMPLEDIADYTELPLDLVKKLQSQPRQQA